MKRKKAMELMIAGLSAAYPAPAGEVLASETRAPENGRAQQDRDGLLFHDALLFRRYDLPGLDGSDRHELLVDQIGAREVSVDRRAAFAEQVLYSQILAESRNGGGEVEVLCVTGGNNRDVRVSSLCLQTLSAHR